MIFDVHYTWNYYSYTNISHIATDQSQSHGVHISDMYGDHVHEISGSYPQDYGIIIIMEPLNVDTHFS